MKMVVVGVNLFYYCIKCISLYEIKPVLNCWFNVKAGKVDYCTSWGDEGHYFHCSGLTVCGSPIPASLHAKKNYLNNTDLKAT